MADRVRASGLRSADAPAGWPWLTAYYPDGVRRRAQYRPADAAQLIDALHDNGVRVVVLDGERGRDGARVASPVAWRVDRAR